MSGGESYRLVKLANGVHSVHALAEDETFHPVIGPVAEAEALYVRQLHLPGRLAAHTGPFVIWDVGLGAAGNALTVLRATRNAPCPLHLVSFDHTLEPLRFALQHARELGYVGEYLEAARELLGRQRVCLAESRRRIDWEVRVGDFPARLRAAVHGEDARLPAPHAILFDAYSPATNPAMWTLPLFIDLFRCLDPRRPCALPTYSRSTILRVSLLLAGFFVGRGAAVGEKEETTLAANSAELIARPLDRAWLRRARRSTSAEPLQEPVYRQAPLSAKNWELLQAHPQFRID